MDTLSSVRMRMFCEYICNGGHANLQRESMQLFRNSQFACTQRLDVVRQRDGDIASPDPDVIDRTIVL